MKKLLCLLLLSVFMGFSPKNAPHDVQLICAISIGESQLHKYCTKNVTVKIITKAGVETKNVRSGKQLDNILHTLCTRNCAIQFRNYQYPSPNTVACDVVYNSENIEKVCTLVVERNSRSLISTVTVDMSNRSF